MAKVGKLTKLKSAMKRWPSFTTKTNHHQSSSSSAAAAAADADVDVHKVKVNANEDHHDHLHVVYVGKCRRPYMLSSDVVGHPLFQQLVDRSSRFVDRDDDREQEIVVACEVVLFEHLLWMLKNSNGNGNCSHGGGGSIEELAEFYTY